MLYLHHMNGSFNMKLTTQRYLKLVLFVSAVLLLSVAVRSFLAGPFHEWSHERGCAGYADKVMARGGDMPMWIEDGLIESSSERSEERWERLMHDCLQSDGVGYYKLF